MAKQNQPQGFQLGNSYLNLIIGAIVVVALGSIVIGLIRSKSTPQGTINKEASQAAQEVSLPVKHTVAKGEDLWKISEKYYKTGYNWVDIAKENNLSNPSALEEGTELTIPVVTPIMPQASESAQAPMVVAPTEAAVAVQAPQTTPAQEMKPVEQPGAITGNSYTVVWGDNLWDIALRAYGDGFRWVDIARVNKLANPSLIHPGNQFVIPR